MILATAQLTNNLLELALLFGLNLVIGVLFLRMRMPPMVGFLVAGAVIGPHGLGVVRNMELVEQLAEIGVIVLLFTVGMELSLKSVAKLRNVVLIGGGLQVALTVSTVATVYLVFGRPFDQAVLTGFLAALSSTAAITKLLGDRGELGSTAGRLAVGICIAQDLAVVPMLLLIPLLGSAAGGAGFDETLTEMLRSFGVLVLMVGAAWWLMPRVLSLVARTRSRELFVLTVIVFCIGCASVTGALGLSLALGAFLAGMVLGSSDFHHQASSEVEPTRDALGSLFFVSIGMFFDIRTIFEEPVFITLALAATVLGKAAIAFVAMKALKLPSWTAARSALMVAQVGEFSFVMLQVAGGHDLLSERSMDRFVVVAVLSIALTPLLFTLARSIGSIRGESPEPVDGELRDHVVIVGFGPAGQHLAHALRSLAIPYRIIELNPETVARLKREGEPAVLGDASRHGLLLSVAIQRARMLVVATNAPDATRRTVAVARRFAPKLHILVRANYLSDVPALQAIGADEIVPQELETSVEMTAHALRSYLIPDDEVLRQVELIRDQSYGIRQAAPTAEGEPLMPQTPELRVVRFRVEPKSALVGRSIGESKLRHDTGMSIVAMYRGEQMQLGVGPETVFEAGDVVIAIGKADALSRTKPLFRGPH